MRTNAYDCWPAGGGIPSVSGDSDPWEGWIYVIE
jgi:hypothetical protein